MTSAAVITLSATVERGLIVGGVVAAIVLVLRAVLWKRGAPVADLDALMSRGVECALLAAILVGGVLARVLWWDDAVTPVFVFSEVTQINIAKMLDTGTFVKDWEQLLHTFQGIWTHESAIVLPVAALLQRLLGVSFGLPVLLGAVFGTAAIVFAWLLGRTVRSQAFGLVFTAFVAFSPLQLTWSRLGGLYIGATTHVLLALLCGYMAGRRRGLIAALVWTVVTGVVAWASLYSYYAARVAISLAGAAILYGYGSQHVRTPWWRVPVLMALFIVTLAGMFHGLGRAGLRQTLWPSYRGYVGNQGEQSVADLIARNAEIVRLHTRGAGARYFVSQRTSLADGDWYRFGMQYGGLCLVPLGVLGAVGLLASLWRLRSAWLWLAVAAMGVALPVLSKPSARRFLVLDLAWSALAAHGLLALASSLGRGTPRRTTGVLAGVVVVMIGVWSTTSVFVLGAALPAGYPQSIPFGESGLGDGLTCRRCVEAAKEWSYDIREGAFVVLFDSDPKREDRTSPGGLPAYGKLAALMAGAGERFIEAYGLMANFDIEPPSPGALYDKARTNFATFLIDRMERTNPARIVWHFERPTQWERSLAQRLVAAGGEMRTFRTPLAPLPGVRGIQVISEWPQRDGALQILHELARGTTAGEESACVRLDAGPSTAFPFPVFLVVATPAPGSDGRPEWLAGTFNEVKLGGTSFEVTMPIAAAIDEAADGGVRLDLVAKNGQRTLIDVPSGRRRQEPLPSRIAYGLDCATRVGEHWWVLEPISGRLFTTGPDASWVPQGPWIGIASDPDGELALASADQTIVVLDVAGRRELTRFTATVPPSKRATTDECSSVAVGHGWIATFNSLTGVLFLYDRQGRALGTRRIDVALGPGTGRFGAMGASGRYLGFGTWSQRLWGVEVAIDPACTAAAAPS